NDDDLTYCKTRFDDTSLATLREHLGAVSDPLARALCWSALWNMARDALLPARDFAALVLRFAGRESDIGVLQMLHAWADSALVHYAAPDWRETGGRLLAEGALRELREAAPGSEQQLAWARFFASVAAEEADLAVLRGLLEGTEKIDGLEVDQELRWTFLTPLSAHGVVDGAVLVAELARDDTASGKRHQVRCLASRPSDVVKAQ
ncbi:aminopeptidase N, partial [Streptomyces sp. SID6648]|nr:aminopeptidase N [Streptomyces sp. SID6648]